MNLSGATRVGEQEGGREAEEVQEEEGKGSKRGRASERPREGLRARGVGGGSANEGKRRWRYRKRGK